MKPGFMKKFTFLSKQKGLNYWKLFLIVIIFSLTFFFLILYSSEVDKIDKEFYFRK